MVPVEKSPTYLKTYPNAKKRYFYDEEWKIPAGKALLQLVTPAGTISNGSDGTGDLYKLINVFSYIKTCGKNSCQIVTADGGFDYTSDFEQELSSYKLSE